MGLDMYLRASKYIGGWKHNNDKEFESICNIMGIRPIEDSPSIIISFTVGYWRKANAIHKWFVSNVQENVDDCGNYPVSREKLEKLRSDCLLVLNSVELVDSKIKNGTTYHADGRVEEHYEDGQVVAQKNIAENILPTQSGFFFGGTDYDSYYIQDLKDTVNIIDLVLKMSGEWDFEYHSSW